MPEGDAAVWNGFTRASLDAAYDNISAVPDSAARLASWSARSAALRQVQPAECDVAYGSHERTAYDIFRCGRRGAPLMAFIHGGWWQRNSRQVFSCMAEGPMAHGVDVAVLGYTLAPEASLTRIAGEIRQALDHLAAHEAGRGGASCCVLSGWSAGGHLTALVLDHPFVAAGLSISGVFDLEPIRRCYINDKLALTPGEVERLSPARLAATNKPLAIAYGLRELPELQRQSMDYIAVRAAAMTGHAADARLTQGLASGGLALAGEDHFSILEQLANPDGQLAMAIARPCGVAPAFS